MKKILDLFALRHSFYNINKNCPIEPSEITDIIAKCMELYPSAFNSQSARLLILFGAEHSHLWNLVKDAVISVSPPEKHSGIADKIAGFANGCGTILFFTDTTVTDKLKAQFPLYADNFDNWAYQGNAILQFMIWSALAEQSIGANVQHYNPLIDEPVAKAFNIPSAWKLVAQMPFGGIGFVPQPHQVEKLTDKFIVYGL